MQQLPMTVGQDIDALGPSRDTLVLVVAVGVCLLGLVIWWTFMARKRLIQDLPTSRAKGVALGLNELIGMARPVEGDAGTGRSPHAGAECLWWHNQFYEKDNDGGWKRGREKRGGPVAFLLEDESGSVRVRPRKADVAGEQVYDGPVMEALGDDATLVTRYLAGRRKQRRVVETIIPVGAPLYVLGTARLPDESPRPYIGTDPEGRRPFLIRLGSQGDALYRERVGVILGFVLAVAGVVGASIAWFERESIAAGSFRATDIDPAVPLVFAAALVALMGAATVVFVYNNLVELRERTLSAWSLIDVQLRRRHDLLPNLVDAVKGHAAHERDVLAAVADLRARLAHDLPAVPTDEAVPTADREIAAESAATTHLLAVLEAYPDVRADESFARLRAELVDTEDRVALAREFYNNSVLALHDRASSLPGALVAWVFELDLAAEFSGGADQPIAPPERNVAIRSSS